MANYAHTKSRIWQWTGIILILCLFGGAYWYFQVRASTLNQSQNDLNTNGLVGLWSFNGDDVSGTTAYDRSGQGNNGTLTNGPTVTDGKVGQALSFDGANDYVAYANNISFDSNDFTVASWFRLDGDAGGLDPQSMIFSQRHNSTGNGNPAVSFYVDDATDKLHAAIRDSIGAAVDIGGTTTISHGNWYHGVVVKTASSLTVYLDGVQNGTTTHSLSGDFDTGATHRYIGRNLYSTGSAYFNGKIDEVRVYNRAITASEVASLYTQGGGTKVNTAVSQPQGTGRLDSGLAGYWKMDDGSGTSATDASTNGNTAYFINTPTWTTGQIGGALDFTDPLENQSLSVADVFDMPDGANFSIAGWFYRSTFNTVDIIIAKTAGLGASYTGYGIYIDDTSDALVLLGADGTDMYTLTSSSTFTGTGWNHFVAVWNDTSANETKLYINGKLENSTASGTFANVGGMSNVDPFHIGSESDIYTSNSRSFRGRLDEIRVYNRTLSADEVAQLYRLTTPTGSDTSLKGYWSFNGQDLSGTTAYDRSGAGNNGTLTNGPAITEGKLGQGLQFDGVNDFVNIGDMSAIESQSQVTFSTWVKPASLVNQYQGILSKRVNNTDDIGLITGGSGYGGPGAIIFVMRNGVNAHGYTSGGQLTVGNWWHIVGVFDGSLSGNSNRLKLYLNGAEQSLTYLGTIPATTTSNSTNMSVGLNETVYFNGVIDEVRIYNRALTAGEISSLYNSGK